jgi:type IV secretion system protein VirB4
MPPADDASRAEGWLYEGRADRGGSARDHLDQFVDRTDRLLNLVSSFVPEAAWLSDAETLSYLHSCVSTKRHKVRVPETPMHLDALLADQPLAGGLEPRSGLAQPAHTGRLSAFRPHSLDELNGLPSHTVGSTRAVCMDKTMRTKCLAASGASGFASARTSGRC